MDTLTHALTGALVSDAHFRRRLGAVATPFALVAGALPDADAVTFFMSVESAWANHRGITHGFLAQIAAAPVLGYIGYRISGKRGTWILWSLLALLSLFAHTVLDLATSWGTMPFAPFSNARLSWDIAPILDLFVLSLTTASFAANRVLRRERVDEFINPLVFPVVHRRPRRQRAADIVAKIALPLVALYLLIGALQNWQTVGEAREELARQGVTPARVRALPVMFTYIAWNIAARDGEGAVYNASYSSYAPAPMTFTKYDTLPPEETAPVLASPLGKLFAWYTQGMFVARRAEDGKGIELVDRRFFGLVDPAAVRSAALFTFSPDGAIADAEVVRRNPRYTVRIGEELDRLWELTWRGAIVQSE